MTRGKTATGECAEALAFVFTRPGALSSLRNEEQVLGMRGWSMMAQEPMTPFAVLDLRRSPRQDRSSQCSLVRSALWQFGQPKEAYGVNSRYRSSRLDSLVAMMEDLYSSSQRLSSWDPIFTASYRWEHTLRVMQYGEVIAAGEGVNPEFCLAACLLHDIAYFVCEDVSDWKDHGRIGADLCRPLLAEVGFCAEHVDRIRYAVACHADGDGGFPHPDDPLADAVSDADNVDRFSAVRLHMWCRQHEGALQPMAEAMRQRVALLRSYRQKSPLLTGTGKQLFAQKLDLHVAFFEAFIEDAERTSGAQGQA